MHRLPLTIAAIAALLVVAATAAAHADIADSTSARGAKARLTVSIEHGCGAESASVDAVDRVAIQLPRAFGRPAPVAMPGWSSTVTGGGPYRVVWTRGRAEAFAGDLRLTTRNPAKPGAYAIPTVQYCGAASIAWIERAVGGVEPDHPVPTVTVG